MNTFLGFVLALEIDYVAAMPHDLEVINHLSFAASTLDDLSA
jgi:hypothetical protein